MSENKNPIGLVALDLDGTTLNDEGRLGERTRAAFKAAMERGVHIVIATGRSVKGLPQEMLGMDGIDYAITSNGALITDLRTGERIYKNCIAPESADMIIDYLSTLDLYYECFTGDVAYMDESFDNEEMLSKYGTPPGSMNYVRTTRTPVPNLLQFMRDHREDIENINVIFADPEYRLSMFDEFRKIPGITPTSSLKRNIELGGETTSKATAMVELGKMLGVEPERIMACGDSLNDMAMMQAAGVAIAVDNASQQLKDIATFVAPDNNSDGVGVAIEKFVLV